MKIIKETPANKYGRRRVLVELGPSEQLIVVCKNSYYKLGYPIEDIVSGNEIAESKPTYWCSISQKWED
jgi:hypothetical protein